MISISINDMQEETLVALFVYGENTTLIAQQRRRTTRMIRNYPQTALEKLHTLGYETGQALLTSEIPLHG
jgi:hypothetical protein